MACKKSGGAKKAAPTKAAPPFATKKSAGKCGGSKKCK